MNEPCPRGCGKPSKPRHTCTPQPGDPEPPLRMESEVEELRRKCAHYHAQRVEADERNNQLEDALRYAVRLLESRRPDGDRVDEFLPLAKELLR